MPPYVTSMAVAGASLFLVAGCSAAQSASSGTSVAGNRQFAVTDIELSPFTRASLCGKLGGNGKNPTITISHTARGGVPIRIRMYDAVSSGNVVEHRKTQVRSDASGTTRVTYGFIAPCNTTGRSTSNYMFDVTAGGKTRTVTWGRYNSAAHRIEQ